MFDVVSLALPQIKAGRVRALARRGEAARRGAARRADPDRAGHDGLQESRHQRDRTGGMGHDAAARRAGPRQHRIDGRRRQDHRAQDRRPRACCRSCRAPPSTTATSMSRSFRSARTSTSARPTTTPTGSTGTTGKTTTAAGDSTTTCTTTNIAARRQVAAAAPRPRGCPPTTTPGTAASPTATRTTISRHARRTRPTQPADPAASTLFPAEQYDNCPLQMMGLSYDWTTMNSLVDQMYPNGNTNQPIGLAWAWQSLVGGGPLTAPAMDSKYTVHAGHHPAVGRPQHRGSLVHATRSTIDSRMYQTGTARARAPTSRPPASRSTRSRSTPVVIRPRPCCRSARAPIPQAQLDQVLPAHLVEPDREHLQLHWHQSQPIANFEVAIRAWPPAYAGPPRPSSGSDSGRVPNRTRITTIGRRHGANR